MRISAGAEAFTSLQQYYLIKLLLLKYVVNALALKIHLTRLDINFTAALYFDLIYT